MHQYEEEEKIKPTWSIDCICVSEWMLSEEPEQGNTVSLWSACPFVEETSPSSITPSDLICSFFAPWRPLNFNVLISDCRSEWFGKKILLLYFKFNGTLCTSMSCFFTPSLVVMNDNTSKINGKEIWPCITIITTKFYHEI